MKNILFICTGNICRSPMAEGLMRHLTRNDKSWMIRSAGTSAVQGSPASVNAVRALQEMGVDLTSFRSQPVTESLVHEADAIFCMTQGHQRALQSLFPESTPKTYLIREFAPDVTESDLDVPDPIGQSYFTYLECRDSILASLPAIQQFMKDQPQAQPTPSSSNPGTLRITLAADHGGFELKDRIAEYLKSKSIEIHDLGTHSPTSVDYPDFAQGVAREVHQGQADLGILVCRSGIGMSITANRTHGVRAALVHDEETAALCRQHNNANVLCLSARDTSSEKAFRMVDAWLNARFEGGRHEQRLNKMEASCSTSLSVVDPDVYESIQREQRRQQENIELIASENFTSPAVLEAQGSVLTNKYAEGYPGKRYYGGCEFVDEVETLAIERAKKLFGAEHANVQPHSGSQANMAVYFSVLQPGDTILTMELAHGGHLTHGFSRNFSGKFYKVIHYGVRQDTEHIDYDQAADLAKKNRPKLITVGASAYPRIIDFGRMRAIADSVGALLFVDMAHIAGLVAAGLHPSPVPFADFVTTTTHKTLRGPRGGLVLCKSQFAKEIDSMVLPGIQGGPLMHVIAGKAVCFHEALLPSFKEYQSQVVRNAQTLANALQKNGSRIVSGGTDNHLMLVDLRSLKVNGKDAQNALDQAGITVNKNLIPYDPEKPLVTSGIRLGTPAVTTRGMKEAEMLTIANLISTALVSLDDGQKLGEIRKKVLELTHRFPLPY